MEEVKNKFNPREYMEMAVKVMKDSIQEPRKDKVSPNVGAVLVKSDGSIETACRGELREGDHAEFTLLERKNRSEKLDEAVLFSTLEPCAPGARKPPKLSCSERIVNARIKKVWIGIEDPDPAVDRKGIKYLQDHGVEVEIFDSDFQSIIRDANKQFIYEAEERAKNTQEVTQEFFLTDKEKIELKSNIDDLSEKDIKNFIQKANLGVEPNSKEFYKTFIQLGLLRKKDNEIFPTGLGLLLFGIRPQLVFPNALIRATFKTAGRHDDIDTIEGPLINQADEIKQWFEKKMDKQIIRSSPERKFIYDYPIDVFLEAIINAIVHRDYDIDGAPIYFEINDDAIIIKSPGLPVSPLKLEQMQRFNAPSLSRNPQIMYVFDQLGLVEQRGLGFQTIKELPKKYGLPLPIVGFEEPYLIFTFPRNRDSERKISANQKIEKLTDEELVGYDYARLRGEFSRKEYELHFKFDTKKAERHLKRMVELGLILRKGSGPGTYYEVVTT